MRLEYLRDLRSKDPSSSAQTMNARAVSIIIRCSTFTALCGSDAPPFHSSGPPPAPCKKRRHFDVVSFDFSTEKEVYHWRYLSTSGLEFKNSSITGEKQTDFGMYALANDPLISLLVSYSRSPVNIFLE